MKPPVIGFAVMSAVAVPSSQRVVPASAPSSATPVTVTVLPVPTFLLSKVPCHRTALTHSPDHAGQRPARHRRARVAVIDLVRRREVTRQRFAVMSAGRRADRVSV